jgi:hypothetical protein
MLPRFLHKRAGALKPSAGKNRPASVGMTRSRSSRGTGLAPLDWGFRSIQDGVDHVR